MWLLSLGPEISHKIFMLNSLGASVMAGGSNQTVLLHVCEDCVPDMIRFFVLQLLRAEPVPILQDQFITSNIIHDLARIAANVLPRVH
jgi:hypothetical protein